MLSRSQRWRAYVNSHPEIKQREKERSAARRLAQKEKDQVVENQLIDKTKFDLKICGMVGCITKLSRYNDERFCNTHLKTATQNKLLRKYLRGEGI